MDRTAELEALKKQLDEKPGADACYVCRTPVGTAHAWVEMKDGAATGQTRHERCPDARCPCGRAFIPNADNLPGSAIYCSGRCAWR